MRTIDDNLNKHLGRIEAVEAHETHDEEVVKTLLGDNTVDNATTAKIKWDTAAADATDAKGKATSNMAILNALGASDVANAADRLETCRIIIHVQPALIARLSYQEPARYRLSSKNNAHPYSHRHISNQRSSTVGGNPRQLNRFKASSISK